MDEAPHEYRFIIDGLSPDRLPMARLAEYMADLARLLGEVESVHFSRIESGSMQTVQTVEPAARPFVRDRLKAVLSAEAPEDAAKAFKALNGRLAADNATGRMAQAWRSCPFRVERDSRILRRSPIPLSMNREALMAC